ncbi:glutamate ABC transporter substrate-binding protein [Yinghuangia soli]|uniref:Glutamate ABC transporter substrate-binding protein n=1 Tax=Yinghuangia soli TaxID=2908204 RepID=A0AA41Q3W5_9ACTN|nr:glutamate ABC transporter substrate-binding protein [Yinghuangia soli]MCF2530241.1 glutamate ABC transporter substrate-binding protein [Yinghuangia soli]
MSMRTATARLGTVLVVLAAGVFGTASSRAGSGPGDAQPAAAAAPAAAAEDAACDTATSLPPAKKAGAKIEAIRKHGSLVVGIDQNSYNWGYRNAVTGEIQGFDIDLAKAIATAIFGEPKLTLKAVPTARRIEAVKNGEVDMIVRTMTITCERMKEVAFSSPYFKVSQSLVVPKSVKAATVAEGLKGKRVCAAAKSSSETELASGKHATAEVKIVENQLDCLVLMQLGKIDATLADTVLAYAQVAQDDMVQVQGEPIVPAFMGIAMNKADTDLIAWVNQVLVDYRTSGQWLKAYDKWLRSSMEGHERWLP